jgi:acetylcholinesterase
LTGQSEDCLFLDIQVSAGVKSSDSVPVIVYLYGGGFRNGGSNQIDPTGELFVKLYLTPDPSTGLLTSSKSYRKPIVWVTVNYRLNGWGFLTGKEAQAAGFTNVGLLDQRAALQWVQANIAAFGGNPNRVVLAGQSAGAISVGAHLLRSEGTGGLYHGAVMLSGSAAT